MVNQIIETTVGRVLFNTEVPEQAGFINQVLNKKALRNIIGDILAVTDVPTTAAFLDKIKAMGYDFAFKGGLSFSLVILSSLQKSRIRSARQTSRSMVL